LASLSASVTSEFRDFSFLAILRFGWLACFLSFVFLFEELCFPEVSYALSVERKALLGNCTLTFQERKQTAQSTKQGKQKELDCRRFQIDVPEIVVNMQKTNKPNKKLISYITPAGGIGFR
jgi:hypothetical protein